VKLQEDPKMVAWTDGVLWLLMTPQLVLGYDLITEAETKPMSTRLGRHAAYVTLCMLFGQYSVWRHLCQQDNSMG